MLSSSCTVHSQRIAPRRVRPWITVPAGGRRGARSRGTGAASARLACFFDDAACAPFAFFVLFFLLFAMALLLPAARLPPAVVTRRGHLAGTRCLPPARPRSH